MVKEKSNKEETALKEEWFPLHIVHTTPAEVTDEEIEKMASQAIKGRFPRKKFNELSEAEKTRFLDLLQKKTNYQ